MSDIDRRQELKDDLLIWLWMIAMIALLWVVGAWPPESSIV